jgi:glutamine amidotransferase
MCRLLGIASSEPTAFRALLREAPNSLATLSEKHPDGWGIAVHSEEWQLEKQACCARSDARFHESALSAEGHVLVAHIRQKTVGPSSIHNTHPFRRGRWVFAHNGTVKDVAHLRRGISRARHDEINGDTDSEVLFAYLLTRIDDARDGDLDTLVFDVAAELRAHSEFGSFNFLLSDGEVTYAHRFGRSLYLLERRPRAPRPAPPERRGHAVLVASEMITSEPWTELPEGTLLRIDRRPVPVFRVLSSRAACSKSA